MVKVNKMTQSWSMIFRNACTVIMFLIDDEFLISTKKKEERGVGRSNIILLFNSSKAYNDIDVYINKV